MGSGSLSAQSIIKQARRMGLTVASTIMTCCWYMLAMNGRPEVRAGQALLSTENADTHPFSSCHFDSGVFVPTHSNDLQLVGSALAGL
jgi:hypothetical protein